MNKTFAAAAAISLALLAGGCSSDNEPTKVASETPTTLYENCAQAREQGAAPIAKGSPGYRSDWDRDGDGIACEVDTTTTPAAPKFDSADYEMRIEKALLAGAGIESFGAACPDITWLCTISDIKARNESIIVITQQVTEDDEELGKRTVIGVRNFVGKQFPELAFVQVNNASGDVLANESI
ncbi:excalibur calcium-binding domain-containing protein [Rhodococcus erythropolis]|uniref:excalibur calcium-binding domain-containing protein n=1 Tax=Rhodococcus erythropolis TaxID=1833 RepID=UPI001BE8986E|nr:excalibur calcium-binding domain-containing protein [Rhodococcus erythropolis]MBT2266470.1 excalibur calcium-binding domain-containing protein [Rhodococcus erythropolis]